MTILVAKRVLRKVSNQRRKSVNQRASLGITITASNGYESKTSDSGKVASSSYRFGRESCKVLNVGIGSWLCLPSQEVLDNFLL
eukprot:c2775_g1_i1 orf=29-280(-)